MSASGTGLWARQGTTGRSGGGSSRRTQPGRRHSPWARPRFLIAAGVVALIAVLGVVLAVLPPGDEGPQAAPAPQATQGTQPSGSASPSASAQPVDPAASVCGLPAGSQVVPVAPPADTSWELVGSTAVPTAPEVYGPGQVGEQGFRSCYAHSPTGALYAAANYVGLTSDETTQGLFAEQGTAEGAGREALLKQLDVSGTSVSGSRAQIKGFGVRNYTGDTAVIDLALGVAGQPGYARILMTLVWEDGDWKFEVPADGTLDSIINPIPDLTGYVPWSGA